jgi:hypothetical protein
MASLVREELGRLSIRFPNPKAAHTTGTIFMLHAFPVIETKAMQQLELRVVGTERSEHRCPQKGGSERRTRTLFLVLCVVVLLALLLAARQELLPELSLVANLAGRLIRTKLANVAYTYG